MDVAPWLDDLGIQPSGTFTLVELLHRPRRHLAQGSGPDWRGGRQVSRQPRRCVGNYGAACS